MRPAPEVLLQFGLSDSRLLRYVRSVRGYRGQLRRFLGATNDEVRLVAARTLSRSILGIIDMDDADHFREGVLKREVTGSVTYRGQRDHSAHTLNNWLLGWYFFSRSRRCREAVLEHAEKRWRGKFSLETFFGHVWQFASIMHDVGYVFEGSKAAHDPDTHSEQAQAGANMASSYFNSRLWHECGFGSAFKHRVLLDQLKVTLPAFGSHMSLAAIAEALADLGELRYLTEALTRTSRQRGITHPWASTFGTGGLPGDAFDLWEMHHREYGSEQTAVSYRELRKAFLSVVFDGDAESGMRMLDHGVCSGLLILLLSTFYYRLRYQRLPVSGPTSGLSGAEQAVVDEFRRRRPTYAYDPLGWWSCIVWGTSAAAIHNMQQAGVEWPGGHQPGHLRLGRDPLAYLGVLVDCLQEWDRYSVFAVPGMLPLQGADVRLGTRGGMVIVDFGSEERGRAVRKSLDKALAGWRKVVDVQP